MITMQFWEMKNSRYIGENSKSEYSKIFINLHINIAFGENKEHGKSGETVNMGTVNRCMTAYDSIENDR